MRAPIVVAVTFAVAGIAAATHAPGERPPADLRAAVERSLDYIEREGFAWMDGKVPMQDGKGCVSCHHVSYGIWSLREAQRQGIERAGTRVDLLERRARGYLAEAGCRAFSCAPLLLAGNHAASGAIARQIAEIQEEDGRWRARGQFPTQRRPIEESDAAATMWALLAVDSAGDARDAAVDWLDRAEPGESGEWLLARLLVADRDGDEQAVETLSRRLVERQNDDGGWPWQADQASDAMTTGQAVYALAISGRTGSAQAALQRGVAYLLATQQADGSWITDSELVSTEHDEDKDYIYTYWGTTWAAIGLSRAIGAVADR